MARVKKAATIFRIVPGMQRRPADIPPASFLAQPPQRARNSSGHPCGQPEQIRSASITGATETPFPSFPVAETFHLPAGFRGNFESSRYRRPPPIVRTPIPEGLQGTPRRGPRPPLASYPPRTLSAAGATSAAKAKGSAKPSRSRSRQPSARDRASSPCKFAPWRYAAA